MLGIQRIVCSISGQVLRRNSYSTTSRMAAIEPVQKGAVTEAETVAGVTKKSKNSIVAAVFESLKDDSRPFRDIDNKMSSKSKLSNDNKSQNLDEYIINAKTVNALLAVSELNVPLSRNHALKIVSILAEWSTINRVKLSDFENDSRFVRICRILGRTVGVNGTVTKSLNNKQLQPTGICTDDLNTVLGVAGDDEAAKLIASISLPQMVKVLSTLAHRKRRSTPLLRSLAFNISSSSERLDLKQCADVLYAMATLNFKDSVLAAKICADIQISLQDNLDKSSVVGSILTSLGILKYRDLEILESLTKWIIKNNEICRPHDLSALFLTSAMLNFKSIKVEDVNKLVPCIVREDFSKPGDWLNHVLALAMLNLAKSSHLESVLSEEFISQVEAGKSTLSPSSKMKFINLNSFAQVLATNYKGKFLPADHFIYDVPLAHAKSKQILFNGMIDALKSLLPTSNHMKTLVDSKMGFLIDALCLFDGNCKSVPLDKEHSNVTKVALMVVDYHDICHGTHRTVNGLTNLHFDLLEKSGYKVLPIPYSEFNTSDKLLKRVQYLERSFKAIIHNK